MEEIEVPTEQAQEETTHHALHAHEAGTGWFSYVALSSALLAGLAAVAALLSGHHANEAMLEQIQAANQWNYYQAKGIKSSVLQGKIDLLKALGHASAPADQEKAEQYHHDQEQISDKAKEAEGASAKHLAIHQIFARSVTFFQIAIAVGAISVLVRRRRFWFVSLIFGVAGCISLIQALLKP